MAPKTRGSPMKPAGPYPAGRPIPWKLPLDDRDALHADATAAGTTVSELVREMIDAAAAKTPAVSQDRELVQQSVRFSQEMLDAITQSAHAVGLDAALWLMLLTTPAGDRLIKQLEAARLTRRRLKR